MFFDSFQSTKYLPPATASSHSLLCPLKVWPLTWSPDLTRTWPSTAHLRSLPSTERSTCPLSLVTSLTRTSSTSRWTRRPTAAEVTDSSLEATKIWKLSEVEESLEEIQCCRQRTFQLAEWHHNNYNNNNNNNNIVDIPTTTTAAEVLSRFLPRC